MKSETIDCFYSSDLERARHTSRLVGGPSGWEAEFMESLRERDLGVLEGMTTEEMLEKNPAEYQSFRNEGPEYQVPAGESFRQFYDRCSVALEDVANRNPGKKIGVVTHGGFLGAIFRYVLNIPLDAERNFVLLNCSVNRLEKSENGWNLVSWGDVSHLDGLDSLDDA
jgi:probable phosphoglycerate mutase